MRSDGASATEIALKMSCAFLAQQRPRRQERFVGLAGGYHGETIGALAVTDIAIFREAYAPAGAAGGHRAQPRCARRAGRRKRGRRGPPRCRRARGLAGRAPRETAALIVEPLVQCAAGMAMHDAEYLRLVRALCDRYEVHLVVDEIATGFGRTGTMFAHASRPASGPISSACPRA